MFRVSLPSVGGITTYVRLFDDKLQICKLEITRNLGTAEGLNTWEEYQDQGNQLIADAARIVAAMNAAPDADRIIRHLSEFLDGGNTVSGDSLMPDDGYDGATEEQTLGDAIRAYLKKVDGGK
jgi:hypothetical protein